ncbi:MAG: cadmium-translocating P-type ATPase [Candidatus Mcinerneyibacterium aminivorans]|uniref:Cadmium-translocating P-type ATPase n=1 Tax=Candidatus Mcinerneyibacterium aminivorans TaxID=2703815 RepID=A0A5D0MI17_9BACT|nr:MAG: cadmium-translocating P-type ATPase [Candidatus Mcinerneyibacterium aminivorans]
MESNKQNHHKMMMKDFIKRFWISVILTVPLLILSPMIQEFFNFKVVFPGISFVMFAIASVTFFYGGWPFLKGLYKELKKRSPGMMTLIALAIFVAYFYSSAVVFGLKGRLFYWELVTLIDIMLLGHWIEMKSVIGASNALEELAKLMPDAAHKVVDEEIQDVPIKQLKKKDIVLVKPGEKIPSDGIIIEGKSYINESMITGESVPVKRTKNDEVIGGSINGDGSIKIKVQNTGEDSYLSKVINLVEESQKSKSKTQSLADRAAFWLTIIALTAGFSTLFVWIFAAGRDLAFSIERMATVMVITCPHALGLAIPLVVAVSTTKSAKNGLLIRNRTAFENSRKITSIVFDKTGTLTKGEFGVSKVEIIDNSFNRNDILKYAASIEQNSEHPIGRGIINEAKNMDIDLYDIKNFKAIKGKGVYGEIDSKEVMVVSPQYMEENNISYDDNLFDKDFTTNVFLLVNKKVKGSISLADEIREESYSAVKKLKDMGIKVWMLTGDNEKTAKAVAEKLNLDGYFAEVLPHEKQKKIEQIQKQKNFVAMTGDGVNDAPALAKADVGIAIGSGTDVAAETADIILVNSNPEDVVSLIKFGKKTYHKMIQNLFWATGYNAIAIPLAAGVLYNQGILISPALGAVLMSFSTIIVAINAKLLAGKLE